MVSAVYDHIVAILVVGAVFVGAVVVLPNMSFNSIQAVDEQQLRNTALSVFDAMLLDTGAPTSWGSMVPFYKNDPNVTRFGLASAQDSTFYVLDPDKVQRLVLTNPLNYLEYEKVRQLLKLEGYGFNLRIVPPFNVTNTDNTPIPTRSPITLNGKNLSYSVKVSYLTGGPIPNAMIDAKIVYAADSQFSIARRPLVSTDSLGLGGDIATLDFEPKYVMVVLRVTVADVATIVVTFGSAQPDNIANINFVGDSLILTTPDVVDKANRWITNIIPVIEDGEIEFLYNGTKDDTLNWGSNDNWTRTFNGLRYRNPTIFILAVWAVPTVGGHAEGRQEVLVAGPYQNLLGFTVFQYGDLSSRNRPSVTIQRSVIISGMTYLAELTLWKE